MTEKKFKFTKASVDALPIPEKGKRQFYYDTAARALAIQVTGNGSKSFYVYRRVEGKPQQSCLGPYPDLSIENARKKAEEFNGQVAVGLNPKRLKDAQNEIPTFELAFEAYMQGHAAGKKSKAYDRQQYERYLKNWANRKINTIGRNEVLQAFRQTGQLKTAKATKGGHCAANRLLSLMSMVFKFALDHGWVNNNPAAGIQKYAETPRHRLLSEDEMKRFLASLADESDPDLKDYVVLCMYTAARPGEAKQMKWADIDFRRERWLIRNPKNGEPTYKPLTSYALGVLNARKENAVSEYVFPGKGGKSHLKEPKRGWYRILDRANISDFHIHDLRAIMSSEACDQYTELNPYHLSQLLGHRSLKASEAYIKPSLNPAREVMEKSTAAILEKRNKVDREQTA